MRISFAVHLAELVLAVFVATGCGQDDSTPSEKATTVSVNESNVPRAETVKAASRSVTLSVDLPGASVHGFEMAMLEAKIGGYVKEIGQFVDPQTGKKTHVDIGTRVAKDDVLAVLDAPEMLDELREKEALVLLAESDVAQSAAAISQAEAQVAGAAAALDEAKQARLEKIALRNLAQAEFDNQQQLFNTQATTRELLAKSRSQLDAAAAGLASADAHIRTMEASMKAAEAHVHKAEADHQNSIAGVKVANATLARTKTLAQYAKIRAPFDGVVSKRMVDHGTFVRPATSNSASMPLFEITRNDKVRVIAKVPMIRAERVQLGQTIVYHSIGGLPGIVVEGHIVRTAMVLDPDSRMLEIQADFTNPVTHTGWIKQDRKWINQATGTPQQVSLKPGMVGTATILDSRDNLAVVPTTAVGVDEGGNQYVLAVEDAGDKSYCRQRVVDVAFNDASEVGISRGLAPGDVVIAKNIEQLNDGQQVAAISGI